MPSSRGSSQPESLRSPELAGGFFTTSTTWETHKADCCCYVASVVSNSVRPHRRKPTRLPRPWDFPGKNTGVGCHFLLQCMKVKSESEVPQSCPTSSDPMDCSLPGSSVHGICLARVLEWAPIAFSDKADQMCLNVLFLLKSLFGFLKKANRFVVCNIAAQLRKPGFSLQHLPHIPLSFPEDNDSSSCILYIPYTRKSRATLQIQLIDTSQDRA